MAKMSDIHFRSSHKAGVESGRFVSHVTVNNDGIFALTLEDALKVPAADLLRDEKWSDGRVWLDQTPKNLRVMSASLDVAKTFIQEVIDDHLAYPIEREPVIIYSQVGQVAYAEHFESGRIYPNGRALMKSEDMKSDDRNQWDWKGPLSATAKTCHYMVGLYARVVVKETHIKPTGTTIEFITLSQWASEEPERAEAFSKNHPTSEDLNSFVGLSGPREEHCQIMPYSDKAAAFFYQTLLGMCQLARRFDRFFEDERALAQAIESGARALSDDGGRSHDT